jgi:F0F1-type ATP synthase assembly protein I
MYINEDRYRDALDQAFVKESGKIWDATKTLAKYIGEGVVYVPKKAYKARKDVKAAKKRARKVGDRATDAEMIKEHVKDPSLRRKERNLTIAKSLVGGGAVGYGVSKAVDRKTGTSPRGSYYDTSNYPVYVT